MIPNMPALGIRFDVNKLDNYGQECWEIFLQCTASLNLKSILLFHGDTANTPDIENVFCIAVQSVDGNVIESIKKAISECDKFVDVCAEPKFVEGRDCLSEPLPEAGKINNAGCLEQGAAFVLQDAIRKTDPDRFKPNP